MSSSNSSGAGTSASTGKKPLPLYYAGIPKDLGKKREQPKEIIPKLDAFGANILANFERSKNLAIQRRKAQEKQAAEAKAAAEAEHKAILQRQAQEDVTQSLRKALGKSSGGGNQLRNRLSGGSSRSGITKSRSTTNGGGSSRGKRRVRKRQDEDSDDDGYGGHSISRKGMERVVMKKKPKAPVARASTTSDYSDMFGDKYLVGADIDATKDLAKASRGELERARTAKRKKQEEYAKKKKEADAYDAIKMKMERTGEAKTRAGKQKLRKLREDLQADTFVRVDEPPMGMGSQNEISGESYPKQRKEVVESSNARIKQALKDRLKNWGHDTSFQKFEQSAQQSSASASSAARRDDRDRRHSYPPPRPAVQKRKRVVDSDESDEEDEYERRDRRDTRDIRLRRESYSSRPPLQKKSRRPSGSGRSRRAQYSSEEEGSEDDRHGASGGFFMSSFGDLEEEEARSAAAGREEDRREHIKLLKHKREKDARRRAAGIFSDEDDD